jgi:hypothetical protein
MAERDPKTGRFVRADAKPVLHRQVSDADPFEWAEITKALRSDVGKPDPVADWHAREDRKTRWLARAIIAAIVLALGVAAAVVAALDGGLI